MSVQFRLLYAAMHQCPLRVNRVSLARSGLGPVYTLQQTYSCRRKLAGMGHLRPSQKRPLRLSEQASKNICRNVNQFTSGEAARRQYESGTLLEPRPGEQFGFSLYSPCVAGTSRDAERARQLLGQRGHGLRRLPCAAGPGGLETMRRFSGGMHTERLALSQLKRHDRTATLALEPGSTSTRADRAISPVRRLPILLLRSAK